MEDFKRKLDQLIANIELARPRQKTDEGYLLGALLAYRKNIDAARSLKEIQNATNALAADCTEHMDLANDLYLECMHLLAKV